MSVVLIGAMSRVGKDTVARKIVETSGLGKHKRFADGIRKQIDYVLEENYGANSLTEEDPKGWNREKLGSFKDFAAQYLVLHGEQMKRVHGETIWIEELIRNSYFQAYSLDVISDWRFPLEAKLMRFYCNMHNISLTTVAIRKDDVTYRNEFEETNEPLCWDMADIKFWVNEDWSNQDELVQMIIQSIQGKR